MHDPKHTDFVQTDCYQKDLAVYYQCKSPNHGTIVCTDCSKNEQSTNDDSDHSDYSVSAPEKTPEIKAKKSRKRKRKKHKFGKEPKRKKQRRDPSKAESTPDNIIEQGIKSLLESYSSPLKQENADLKAQIKKLETVNRNIVIAVADKKTENDKLRKNLNEAVAANESLRKGNAYVNVLNDALQKRNDKLIDVNEKEKKHNMDLIANANGLNAQIRDLQNRFDKIREVKLTLEMKRNQFDKELKNEKGKFPLEFLVFKIS